jgi:hydrogenase maturation protease
VAINPEIFCRETMRPDKSDSGRIVVLGLGNILLSDEGVGVHAVTALKERFTFSPPIDIIDGGTMGLDLLPLFQERDRILIIDAVDFRKPSGHVGTVEGDAIAAVLNTKLSVHHIGLADLLFTAKLMRETPLEIHLVGIQPHSLDVGIVLSDPVQSKLDMIIELTVRKLADWNVAISRAAIYFNRDR